MSEYLYGKSGQCITFENSETACKWRDFDNECLSVADDEDADLYPHGTTTTTTNITTTTTTTITTTTHPRFRQLKKQTHTGLGPAKTRVDQTHRTAYCSQSTTC